MEKGIGVIIPAAGAGTRLGGVSKPLIEIGGQPVISRILTLFSELDGVKKICLAVPKSTLNKFRQIVLARKMSAMVEIVEGGDERSISVRKAYEFLKGHVAEDDLICVHDAARPLLSEQDLNSVVAAGWKYGAAFLATKIKDTLKFVDSDGFAQNTIDRSNVYGAQTPQVMLSRFLSKAYASVRILSDITDETMLMEKIGVKSFVVESKHLNFKLTTPQDLALLKKLTS
jgi:2-C-methyl-D-erythritol 4-phosphate cytidylyltransferase